MTTLTYHLYWIKCADCKHQAKFPVYELDGYMLLRNPNNLADVRVLNWEDNALSEVGAMAKNEKKDQLDELNLSKLHRTIVTNLFNGGQKLFQFVADPSNKVKYQFDAKKICAACGSYDISGWGPTEDPYETIKADFPMITHNYWDSLTLDAKKALVKKEIERGLLYELQQVNLRAIRDKK